jgi:hypothetical protein
VLRDDEGTAQVIRYLIENPVRAGLVKSATDYPFIGSSKYSLEELGNFCLDVDLQEKRSSA